MTKASPTAFETLWGEGLLRAKTMYKDGAEGDEYGRGPGDVGIKSANRWRGIYFSKKNLGLQKGGGPNNPESVSSILS